jgi:hypothetical protein
MDRAYTSILGHIEAVYEKNESRAVAMNQERRKKTGDSSLGPTK